MQITDGIIKSAQKIVIYGPEGIGKSTLASCFPNPVFSDTEGSTKKLNVRRTPKPSSWTMLLDQAKYCKANPMKCDTFIADTADWAEKLCKVELCDKANKTGIEDFGYGKGYTYLAEEFGRFLNLLEDLIELGINVVLVAHAQMRKFEQPDEMGAYDRWEMKLEKKVAPMVREWADMVLFCNYKTYVIDVDGQGTTKGRNKAQGGKRVMYTSHHPCWDAKNRHDLPDEISMDFNEIKHCIYPRSELSGNIQSSQKYEPVEEPVKQVEQKFTEPPHKPEEIKEKPINTPQFIDKSVPKALADLMQKDGATIEEVQKAVVKRGYYPKGTPFANYDKKFVAGVLIAAWPQVFKIICDLRQSSNEKPY